MTTEPPPLERPVSKLRWSIHLLLMAALPLLAGLAPLPIHGDGPILSSNAHGLLKVCLVEVLIFVVPFALAWLFSRATKEQLLLRWRPGAWVVPLGALYSVAIRLAMGIVLAMVAVLIMALSHQHDPKQAEQFAMQNRPQVEKLVDVHAMSADPAYYWLNVVLVSMVIGGLREEVWRGALLAGLRGVWPGSFDSWGGKIAVITIAALLFGVGHLPQGLLAAGGITIVGFCLGWIMVYHRSIWPSVMAHGLFDATSLAFLPKAMEMIRHLPPPHA